MKKKKSSKRIKAIVSIIVLVIFIYVAFIVITDIIADYPEAKDFYFVRYDYTGNIDEGVSTICYYDAEEDEVHEIGNIQGCLARSAVNKESNYIIGVLTVSKEIIKYDLDSAEIVKSVSYEELEAMESLEEEVYYNTMDFDFTDDANGIYITMRIHDSKKIYLYDFDSEQLEYVCEGEKYSGIELVNNEIYYINDNNLYKYDLISETHMKLDVLENNVTEFVVSPNAEEILIYDRQSSNSIWDSKDDLYLYKIDSRELTHVESAYLFSDMNWNDNAYIYVEKYWGAFSDRNPTIKINTSRFGPDKVVYRIGNHESGFLYLVEIPGQ